MSTPARLGRFVAGARRPDDPEPDYLHWKRRERWPAPAATCLLLEICPESLLGRGLALCWHSEAHRVDRVRQQLAPWAVALFDEARRVVEYVDDGLHTCSLSHGPYPPDFDALEPRTFLRWAQDKAFEIPGGLSELLLDNPSREALKAELERVSEELAALRSAPPASASADTQRIRTLQRMVLAMARDRYGWGAKGRNAATGEKDGSIAADVVKHLGERRKLSTDAIRDALTQAAEEFPGRED